MVWKDIHNKPNENYKTIPTGCVKNALKRPLTGKKKGMVSCEVNTYISLKYVSILNYSSSSFKSANLKTTKISLNDILVIKVSYAKTKFSNSL